MIIIVMNTSWKRETPLQNIAFIAMMAAINGVFSIILSFILGSAIAAALILPCVNALAIYVLKPKWIAVYCVSALAIPLIVTCYDLTTTLFYIIPSISAGLIYGALNKFKCPVALTILACSLWTLGTTYLSFYLIGIIYEVDMINSLMLALGKGGSSFAASLFPSLMFAVSWGSISINHLVMYFIHEKLGFETKTYSFEKFLYPILVIVFSDLSLVLAFHSTTLTYLFFSLSLFFTLFTVPTLLKKVKFYYYIILAVLLVAAFFAFAIFAKQFGTETVIALGTLFLDAIALTSFISLISKKQSC